ncbi:MAG: hypothetical protein RL641_380 [Candidatus Parcubacteria bacterium]|jgi:hypothetical protein
MILKTPISRFFFAEKHPEIDSKELFASQREMANFASKVPGTPYTGKKPETIQASLSLHLNRVSNHLSLKHTDAYRKIFLAKIKRLKPEISNNNLTSMESKFEDALKRLRIEKKSNDTSVVTVKMLEKLIIVAKAFGGKLSKEQFSIALQNIANE